ncbi:MAG: Gfo/Idh/MocA family oxidoreductase, partial [Dysgonamonadaceae bacterium]|nr:Gfo/Idh/MocA family oxidoreductase [Dysgonamonadaceae bacterium]
MKTLKNILCIACLCALFTACCGEKSLISLPTPARQTGQTDVLQLRCDPIPVVRIGFIGIGMRGSQAISRMSAIEGTEIKAICDLEPYNLEQVQTKLAASQRPAAAEYTGENGWKELCERDDIDLIYICTDWLNHTPIAVYAMERGKHVAIEVPAAVTVNECWQLVNTSEKTRRHCMMLENCCYDKFEMATLNMVQSGLLGEIVHVEGAYIHDLRELNFNDRQAPETSRLTGYWNFWRKKYNIEHTGNPYPTHGFGPICQALNIHRGDKLNYLTSVSSNQFGMTEYAKNRFGKDSPEAAQPYALGDMNTTLIKTQKGKTIMIQHDVTSPR